MSDQPGIADVLGIRYDEPIADADAWARVFPDPAMAPTPPRPEMFHGVL